MSVKGLTGLEDQDRMLDELAAETGLSWRSRAVDEGRVLTGGIVEIVLVAAVGKATEMTVSAAVDAVKRVVERWRGERLDPPETSVGTESVPDSAAEPTVEGLDG
ncbi:hypothetical protein M878_07390 [Streptomyces roseochromogenus subsp. oscitans DS 12.976]|uniref:Uncharacterized protein n=1 Tax=Streptomyces roseochromogenus subsp. oscitans DS 12.976 TaxID=1352936 RepID=V6L1D7_STRRC|nr:hypothetical protein M878_07390 [Streptomyces roseochromogenus subsp. oscitans DS 12.976]